MSENGRFRGQPIETLILPPSETLGRELKIAIHPNSSGRIIINYPGANGDIDGFNGKHRTLAYYMQAVGLGAVLRCSNRPDKGEPWEAALRAVVKYGIDHAEEICGNKDPDLLLIGTSAGGGAVAAIAYEYEAVKRLLLMAPATDPGKKAVRNGLARFTGEIYIVIGQEDEVVQVNSGRYFYDLSIGASKRELFVIPNCDHQFSGEANGRIMSQAPFYAFAKGEKPKFPQPNGGIKLY